MATASFENEFLAAHNSYRARHGAPPLTMSPKLSASAQRWANHLLSINTLTHSNDGNGENLYFASNSAGVHLTGKEAVDSWYNEIKDYNFRMPGFRPNTGHFTQVVWKSTSELGVGVAMRGNVAFVVGQYHPAGNITNPGYFQQNVLPKV
ncbi:Golgi-associated plant pathogenesis-related protein 1 [Pholidichthys leucotaenia]